MSGRVDLGQSAEDYLEAVYVASLDGRPARVTDIAEQIGVSKPSVVSALASLEQKGMVTHERYRGVELTDQGEEIAREVYRRHRFIAEFLRDVLGVDEKEAAQEACELEHVLSPDTVERLARMVEFYRAHSDEKSVSLVEMRRCLSSGKPRVDARGKRHV